MLGVDRHNMSCPGKLQAWSPKTMQAALGGQINQIARPKQCCHDILSWLQSPKTGRLPLDLSCCGSS